ncbi:MAG: TIR domain-containing protein [Nitrospira sp.]
MPRVFISYRREDSAGWTGRLAGFLREQLGNNQVFMDIDTIPAGVDFAEYIRTSIGSCEALVVVIGPRWLTATDARGQRRLQDTNDYIRMEITTAISRNLKVIPVLVGGATMPRSEDLPDDLKTLAGRNALEITDRRWDYDAKVLVSAIPKTRLQEKTLARQSSVLMLLAAVLILISGICYWLLGETITTMFQALQQNEQKLPVAATPVSRTQENIGRISSSLITELNHKGKPGYEVWAIAQSIVALSGQSDLQSSTLTDTVKFFRQDQKDAHCQCWKPFNQQKGDPPHIPVSAWVLVALARSNQAASDDELDFLLKNQQRGGWWPIYPTRDGEHASSYATSWALLALHEQYDFATSVMKPKIENAMREGNHWLTANRIKSTARWKDYPLATENGIDPAGKESEAVSGLVIHTMHKLGYEKMDDIDQLWLDSLPNVIPLSTDAETPSRYIDSLHGRIFDNTRYLRLPWLLIGTVDAYANGGLGQKLKTIYWVHRVLEESDIVSSDVTGIQNWNRAEILISLKYLMSSHH